jgi:hypothetical protein
MCEHTRDRHTLEIVKSHISLGFATKVLVTPSPQGGLVLGATFSATVKETRRSRRQEFRLRFLF